MNAAATAAPSIVAVPARRRWMPVLAFGALWGLAASAMESVVLPVRDGHWSTFWLLVVWNFPVFIVVGLGIAIVIELGGLRVDRPLVLAVSVVVGAVTISAAWLWILTVGDASGLAAGIRTIFPQGTDPLASFLYQTWVIIFYGGLYVMAWTINQRTERTRQALAQAEVARIRTETLLGEAHLQLLRGNVDPQLLLRVMSEVERRYANDAASADRLVGLLVAFLRLAMPGVRNGRSTLADETNLARAYIDLRTDLEPHFMRWEIDAPEAIPELPFPPLLLLPILDRVAVASSPGRWARMSVTLAAGKVTLAFEGSAIDPVVLLTPALSYRIGVGVATLYDRRWSLVPRAEATTHGPALLLEIRTDAAPGSTVTPGRS